jgi:hypothetical protein
MKRAFYNFSEDSHEFLIVEGTKVVGRMKRIVSTWHLFNMRGAAIDRDQYRHDLWERHDIKDPYDLEKKEAFELPNGTVTHDAGLAAEEWSKAYYDLKDKADSQVPVQHVSKDKIMGRVKTSVGYNESSHKKEWEKAVSVVFAALKENES